MRPAVLPTGGVRGRGPWQTPPKTAGSGDGVLAKFFVESHPPFSWLVSGQVAVVRPTKRGAVRAALVYPRVWTSCGSSLGLSSALRQDGHETIHRPSSLLNLWQEASAVTLALALAHQVPSAAAVT